MRSKPSSLHRRPVLLRSSAAQMVTLCAASGLALLEAGCSGGGAETLPPSEPPAVGVLKQATAAADGDLTVDALNSGPQNRYARLTTDAVKGDQQLVLTTVEAARLNPLKAGDLLLVMQAQGALIDSTDADAYGTVSDLQGAGLFEEVGVRAVVPNPSLGIVTLQLDGSCGGLRNSYSVAGKSQVVRVPQYGTLTVQSGGAIRAQKWNGTTGGVLALRAQKIVVESGATIDAVGAGFRGGVSPANLPVRSETTDVPGFRGTDSTTGAQKGEGIASQDGYASFGGGFGRGAGANGGGGGNAFTAGGGGGGGAGDDKKWSGHGVMDKSVLGGDKAWLLDPAYIAAGNLFTVSTGGGRGGYSKSSVDLDALTNGPNLAGWSGNLRRERGGRGGHPTGTDYSQRLHLGGGGGAGDQSILSVGAPNGGNGGGIIYLVATRIEGSGSISADGDRGGAGSVEAAAIVQGGGGGGGGGSVVLNAGSVGGNLSISARGGSGGDQQAKAGAASNTSGPGGGGGGGLIAVPSTTPATVTRTSVAGKGGTTSSAPLSEFPRNGATDGNDGTVAINLDTNNLAQPICLPVDLRVGIQLAQEAIQPGATLTYLVTVNNDGPEEIVDALVSSMLTPTLFGGRWSCTAYAPAGGSARCASSGAVGDLITRVSLPAGGSATFVVTQPIPDDQTDPIDYKVTATPPTTVSDINPRNNQATAGLSLKRVADLSIDLIAAPTEADTQQPVTYALAVHNRGPNAAQNVEVTLDLPQNATLISGPYAAGWTCTVENRLLRCTIPQILVADSVNDISLSVEPDLGITELLASAYAKSDLDDPDLRNNGATVRTVIHYDPAVVRKRVLAGGGLSCQQSAFLAGAGPSSTGAGLGMLLEGALAYGLFAARRLRRKRRV